MFTPYDHLLILVYSWFLDVLLFLGGTLRNATGPVLRNHCGGVWGRVWNAGNRTGEATCKSHVLPCLIMLFSAIAHMNYQLAHSRGRIWPPVEKHRSRKTESPLILCKGKLSYYQDGHALKSCHTFYLSWRLINFTISTNLTMQELRHIRGIAFTLSFHFLLDTISLHKLYRKSQRINMKNVKEVWKSLDMK